MVSMLGLMVLVLASLVMVFVGGGFAEDLLGFIGLGSSASRVWNVARWPGALAVAMLVFAFVYYVTPDVRQRSFRWVTPGAVVGVLLWPLASSGFAAFVSRVADVGALYRDTLNLRARGGWAARRLPPGEDGQRHRRMPAGAP